MFATDLMILKLVERDTIHFDGTFKVVPYIFYQLFTIFIQYKGHAIPALHILMISKNENLYTAVVLSLHQYIPDFTPLMAICDFEKAPRNSFLKNFPHLTLVGCRFHYTKALHDKIRKLGPNKLYLTNKILKKWVCQLMALPFLTEEEIHPTFVGIHLELLVVTDLELELVSSFKNYFIKQWIDGSQSLSIFYNEVTTNNGAECYHNTLKSYIKTSHPNTWKFMSTMDKVKSDYDLEVKRLDDGLEITRLPKIKSRKNAELRTQYKTKYLNRIYSPLEYINAISLTIGGQNQHKQNISNEQTALLDEENPASSRDEELREIKCHVCLEKMGENFALLHESYAHAGFCESCANKIHQLKHDCPICRGKIVGIMRVFQ